MLSQGRATPLCVSTPDAFFVSTQAASVISEAFIPAPTFIRYLFFPLPTPLAPTLALGLAPAFASSFAHQLKLHALTARCPDCWQAGTLAIHREDNVPVLHSHHTNGAHRVGGGASSAALIAFTPKV